MKQYAPIPRHVEDCPHCTGLVTEDDILFGRPFLRRVDGGFRLLQRATLDCPHCGRKTVKQILGPPVAVPGAGAR